MVITKRGASACASVEFGLAGGCHRGRRSVGSAVVRRPGPGRCWPCPGWARLTARSAGDGIVAILYRLHVLCWIGRARLGGGMEKVDYDARLHAVYPAGRQMSPDALQTWMEAFARHLPGTRPLVWLDLGSGTGRMTPSLASAFGGPAHVVDREGAARELRRVVKPGGKLFVQANFSDRMPDVWWFRVVPEWRKVDTAQFRSEEAVESDFVGAGWTLVSRDEVTWLRSASLAEDSRG